MTKIDQYLINKHKNLILQIGLICLWMFGGSILRFADLTAKPLWIDECATLVFSLGNSFQTVALNYVISGDAVLQPLQPGSHQWAGDVIHHILTEDTHPALYFVLAHFWVKLFPLQEGLVSLWAERSFSAFLGVLSIPGIYILARYSFSSKVIGQWAAAMMAVSPFAIALAQEARHYTLSILWVMASLGCLIVVIRQTLQRKTLSWSLVFLWIFINGLGVATHYFFLFTLASLTITLAVFIFTVVYQHQSEHKPEDTAVHPIVVVFKSFPPGFWQKIALVGVGTLVTVLVWLPAIAHNQEYGNLSAWLKIKNPDILTYIYPFFQILATWIQMICLLPVEAENRTVVILSGLLMLAFVLWIVPILMKGLRSYSARQTDVLNPQILQTLIIVILAANLCFLGVVYGLATDLTRAPRYAFVYFPAVVILIGVSLAFFWENPEQYPGILKSFTSRFPKSFLQYFSIQGQQLVIIIVFMGVLSGITIVSNLAYQKPYRPDILVPIIAQNSSSSPLLITTHRNLTQIGEMMGIAWEFKFSQPLKQKPINPAFLFLHSPQNLSKDLDKNLDKNLNRNSNQDPLALLNNSLEQLLLKNPLDVWFINFKLPESLQQSESLNHLLQSHQCTANPQPLPPVNGYTYQHFQCLN